jgi:starch phosphorylase
VRQAWSEVRVEAVETEPPESLSVGQSVQARVRVRLGALEPQDVAVELYEGRLDAQGEITEAVPVAMQPVGLAEPGVYFYEAAARPLPSSGLRGFTIRVLPFHPELPDPLAPGLITWAS